LAAAKKGFGLARDGESFGHSRGDWPDQTAEANLVSFSGQFRASGPAIPVSTDKGVDIVTG